MKNALIFIASLATAGGCASYTQSKIDLAAQAQQGVAQVREHLDASRLQTHAASDALRSRLDAAFDEDVAARPELDAAWVIAHRKAYALAIDAFESDRRAAGESELATLRTLDVISAALGQLQQMHAGEMKLTIPELAMPEAKR